MSSAAVMIGALRVKRKQQYIYHILLCAPTKFITASIW